jgi:spore coat polysaccharide biosynthesis predicted glycosyltransferase SpsG
MLSFLVRCDANIKNGFGHFSRCLNLARGIRKKMPDVKIVFFGDFDAIPAKYIDQYQMEQQKVPASLDEELAFAKGFDGFILDSYLITQAYIDSYAGSGVKFIKFDDYNEHQLEKVDLAINMCLRAPGYPYHSKRSCLGVQYLPVRQELREIRLKNMGQIKKEVKKVVVFLGAADPFGAGVKIIKALDETLKGAVIGLITNKAMGSPVSSMHNNRIEYWPVSFEIETYLKDADAAITSGGITMYDCTYSCIPNASLTQNQDQEEDALNLEGEGLVCHLGMTSRIEDDWKQVTGKLKEFFLPAVRESLAKASQKRFFTDSNENLVNAVLEAVR